MKLHLLALFLLWQTAPAKRQEASPAYLRYKRMVTLPPGSTATQACTLIDAQVFPHAAPYLTDLRLYPATPGSREFPYAITLSEPDHADNEPAQILNLGMNGSNVSFDLQMPPRPYADITLDLDGHDFLATATITGHASESAPPTSLGSFTLFDLSAQRLSRSTTLHLQESTFPRLHVELSVAAAPSAPTFIATPQLVRAATVPPSREAQTLYVLSAETTVIENRGRQTIARLTVPQRVPIERISFTLAPNFKSNFSRDVRILDRPDPAHPDPARSQSQTPPSDLPIATESITGTIQRVYLTQAGREIRQQQLAIPATLGANMQSAAAVEVYIENGDDAPLPITSVRLEMRERRLCFEPPADGAMVSTPPAALTLLYGDPTLPAPQYDFARLFTPTARAVMAPLGPEQINPNYTARPDSRPLTERHPTLLWIALLAVVCSLALVAFRSTAHHHPHK